jgi:hypothetical protein
MKISPRSTALALTAAALLAISACGGSDTPDQKDVPVSTYQKNAALSFTTLPATTTPTMKPQRCCVLRLAPHPRTYKSLNQMEDLVY